MDERTEGGHKQHVDGLNDSRLDHVDGLNGTGTKHIKDNTEESKTE